ncbi:MAG: protein-methionine-sulfoxide reductase catalytic subunit MsrP [Verrucomicrobia bacterium]|nr:MAG: protein-methionine-sulfoxide reductase catalytic subunit MsrP [Verrucomicrobiota bacterium]
MHVHRRHEWELPESAVTPESVYQTRAAGRRRFLAALGIGVAAALRPARTLAATVGFPSSPNPDYDGRGLEKTPWELVTSYNNFYEFGTDKRDPKRYANRGWQTEPWTVEIAGLVRNPGRIDVGELVRRMGGIEQRVYRHRCVEAWSMVVPWDGFALKRLIEFADPTEEARFVRFVSFFDPDAAPGQRRAILEWPYVEGLRLDEATNELAFIATGIYGKPIPNQNGAPLRLVVPWKYGFKGIKSIVRIEFTREQPATSWNRMAPHEYGFLANVNPQVDHPRWSQATERIIGAGLFAERRPTLMFNGYARQVAHLYEGIDLRRHY